MRILSTAIMALLLAGCTSILLGDASSHEGGATTEERSSSQVAADNAISAAIRQKLSADSVLNQYAIGIATSGGKVTLSGTVGSYVARDRAVQLATDTDGVRSVSNRIIVNTNRGTY